MHLIIVLKSESDTIKIKSDFLISFLNFDDVLVMTLSAFGTWGTETIIIQKLNSALNYFILLTEVFLLPAFAIFDTYHII